VTRSASTSGTSHALRGSATTPASLILRRLHGAAVVRIVFGLLWAADASFKWLPGFIHGQTLSDELGNGAKVSTPVIHQWLQMWNSIGTSSPGAFAMGTAIVETLIALLMITGLFSNLVFIGSAIFSFGIWSSAEGFHLPFTQGMTDLGPSVGYIFASLALYYACAGATWSLDAKWHGRLGGLSRLASKSPQQLGLAPSH
jgi:uncharacterized membrane protein YphA (DoxX/SURF4 family)